MGALSYTVTDQGGSPTEWVLTVDPPSIEGDTSDIMVTAKGNLSLPLGIGAYVTLVVKLGSVTILKKQMALSDVCDDVPTDSGYVEISMSASFGSNSVPAGKYSGSATLTGSSGGTVVACDFLFSI